MNIRRHISFPILFRGEAIGLFQVANRETDYTEADIRLLEIYCRGYVRREADLAEIGMRDRSAAAL